MHLEHRVKLPTQGMVEKAGILGRITVDIYDKPGGTRYLSVSDILVRKTKDGTRNYVDVPQRKYEQGGETKYANIVFFFPDHKEWWKKWTERAIADWKAECAKQNIQPGSWVDSGGGGGGAPPQQSNDNGPSFGSAPSEAKPVPQKGGAPVTQDLPASSPAPAESSEEFPF